MILLNILLLILKILAIIILGVFILLLIVLFGGIKYHIRANYKQEPYYCVEVSYLLGLLKYSMKINEENQFKVLGRIFEKKEKKLNNEIQNEPEINNITTESTENIETNEVKETKKTEKYKTDKTKRNKKNKRKSPIQKIRDKFDKFKQIYNHPQRKIITKHIIVLIKRLFKAIKPKKFVLKGIFGFDDPALTGYVLGVVSVIKAFVPFIIDVDGDFQREILDFELEVKGKTNLFSLLLPIILFVTKKPIWNLIRKDEEDV